MFNITEFRQDLVSGDWVLFSTGRAKRPHPETKAAKYYQPKEGCPFEDPEKSGQEVIWSYPDGKDWQVMVIKNKFPAVKAGVCGPGSQLGPFQLHDAVGSHDVVVFRNHDIHLADFSVSQAAEVIKVYKKRYQEIASQGGECTQYISIFYNYGREAGASIYHPHSQIISTPILPPDVSRSIYGAYRYYRQHQKRVYDVVIEWEMKEKKRIVYENEHFVSFCPFVSKTPYEVRIFSKESHAHFEKMPDNLDKYLADALIAVLGKIKKVLGDAPYNFFIHTVPVGGMLENIHDFYHWHIEILPKLSMTAGFELGTGVDINVVDPDQAAEELRKV